MVKVKIASGVCSCLFLTFAFICPSVSAATTASDYRQLGLLYRQQGQYPKAIEAMQKSVALEPENIMGRVNLGWTQHLAGKEEAAAKSLWEVIYRKPLFVPAYNALGIVYLVDGNLSATVLLHTWAAILKPDNEVAYYNLSLALHRLQVYNLAILTANRSAILEPNNPHPLVAAAIAYWDSGDKKTARKIYQKAINLDSRYSSQAFFSNLKQAAFSSDQIQTVEQVRIGSTAN
ncbi:tetratricopeptide repeat protein [Aetokthonos hydrillicola Thurmond2011]|jgi:tetratricopeptide (TPR) repeat protein|uniref:Tetratricopeptide repeat protein n=1 Tax=Aetokthonos hydrillicola Thurmond2011 TaxID=2712845 RepID=A0AAP5I8H7_9CYAN|nr:tetratricopeptide repeat protein [Aetokthonos hydrillicola]MBO3460431.1 tetratricopeptide repeat protein [Aetokthonos hydrillicola CCALA 1050]MBW4588493.1 tetratricopeptide repeat protein [Aetokthonos hydrillicola CCALA 1050]MDR9896821.1 tetratricopeptide repeat protein [Aetokthonos hydrillicola Thurmond2011]